MYYFAIAVNVVVATYVSSGIVGVGFALILTWNFNVVVEPEPGVGADVSTI
jgi:hypothetical protein